MPALSRVGRSGWLHGVDTARGRPHYTLPHLLAVGVLLGVLPARCAAVALCCTGPVLNWTCCVVLALPCGLLDLRFCIDLTLWRASPVAYWPCLVARWPCIVLVLPCVVQALPCGALALHYTMLPCVVLALPCGALALCCTGAALYFSGTVLSANATPSGLCSPPASWCGTHSLMCLAPGGAMPTESRLALQAAAVGRRRLLLTAACCQQPHSMAQSRPVETLSAACPALHGTRACSSGQGTPQTIGFTAACRPCAHVATMQACGAASSVACPT